MQVLLKSLPPNFETPIVVVQHLPADVRIQLDLVYGHSSKMKLLEVTDKMPIEKGCVYFAAPSYHLLIEKDFSFSLSQDDLVYYSRPSIQVFFESAALSVADRAIAVLLTGANEDGGEGLCILNQKGAITIVEDPKTAEIATMPQSALKKGFEHEILALPLIAQRLVELTTGSL